MLGGYTQTQGMNYLKGYLIDYFKRDVREIVDILIIRGQWTTNLQMQQLSDVYHGLLEMPRTRSSSSTRALSDEGELGSRIKSALMPRATGTRSRSSTCATSSRTPMRRPGLSSPRSGVALIAIGRHLKSPDR